MRKVALRGLLAHKARMFMTVGAVTLGVAFISGVLTFTDTMQRSFDDLFATVYEGTDAVVRSDQTVDTEFGWVDRGTLDEDLVEQVRQVPTVAMAAGEVEGFAQIIGKDGEVTGTGPFGDPTYAGSVDSIAYEDWSEFEDLFAFGLRDGEWPMTDDQIVLDAATVSSSGYEFGDLVPIQTESGREEYELVGSIGFGTSDSAAGMSVVLFTTTEAQRMVGEPGRLDVIMVVATEGTSQQQVVEDVAQVLPDEGVEVITGEEVVAEIQSDVREGLSFFTVLLLVFASVAVVVGSFVIYNSFSITIAQRAREMALLRAIGATRSQVRRSVLIEALAIGVVGSLLGLAMGIGLAALFGGLLDIDGPLTVLPASVVTALVVGMVVTTFSSLWPARRAGRVPPVTAMRQMAVDESGRSLVRMVLGALLLLSGAGLSALGATQREVGAVGIGIGLTFLGIVLAAPALARPVGGALGWPLARLRGVTGSLARENAVRNPRRTASTALALTIGVGIVAFFLVLNSSIRASFEKVLDDNFAGDFVVEGGAFGMIGLPEEVAQRLAELDEMETVAPLRIAPATIDEQRAPVTGTHPATFGLYGAEIDGSGELGPGEVVVAEGVRLDGRELELGDELTISFLDDEDLDVTVTGFYDIGPGINLGNYIIGLDEIPPRAAGGGDTTITVELAAGVAPDDGRAAIEGVVADLFPTAEVQDVDDYQESIASQLDIMLMVVFGLLILTIIIALFGIANTIGLSVVERTNEVGLLRAVGATRGQLRGAIRGESMIIALFGTVLGMAVGVLGSWAVVTALADDGFQVFELPVVILAVVAVAAAVLGALAAIPPAWRAARLDVLTAINTE